MPPPGWDWFPMSEAGMEDGPGLMLIVRIPGDRTVKTLVHVLELLSFIEYFEIVFVHVHNFYCRENMKINKKKILNCNLLSA